MSSLGGEERDPERRSLCLSATPQEHILIVYHFRLLYFILFFSSPAVDDGNP